MTTVARVQVALAEFHDRILDRDFVKNFGNRRMTERNVSLPLRFFLDGFFGRVHPESKARLKYREMRKAGRPRQIDFLVGNLALEVAAAESNDCYFKLKASANTTEVSKLLKHKGKSVLALLDFARRRIDPDMSFLTDYELCKPFGNGRHHLSPYTIIYLYRVDEDTFCRTVRIKVPR